MFFVNRTKVFGSPLNDIVFVNISKSKFEHRVLSKTYRSVFIISHVIRYGFKDTDVCSHMEGEDVVDYKLLNR